MLDLGLVVVPHGEPELDADEAAIMATMVLSSSVDIHQNATLARAYSKLHKGNLTLQNPACHVYRGFRFLTNTQFNDRGCAVLKVTLRLAWL